VLQQCHFVVAGVLTEIGRWWQQRRRGGGVLAAGGGGELHRRVSHEVMNREEEPKGEEGVKEISPAHRAWGGTGS
jgi:hypothetical protein